MGNQTNILDEQIKQVEEEIVEYKLEIADLFIGSRKFATFENLTNPKKFSEALEVTARMSECLSRIDIARAKLDTFLLCRTQLEDNEAAA